MDYIKSLDPANLNTERTSTTFPRNKTDDREDREKKPMKTKRDQKEAEQNPQIRSNSYFKRSTGAEHSSKSPILNLSILLWCFINFFWENYYFNIQRKE